MEDLREYVRLVLEEKQRQADYLEDEDLLLEPDDAEEEEDSFEENPAALQTISTVLSIAQMGASLMS